MDTTMTTQNPALKYLFIAEYSDGQVFKQHDQDISYKDPKRSSFYDIDHHRLATFCLVNPETQDVYGVSLIDGHFEINGHSFFLHNRDMELTNVRVIFFRRHLHSFNQDTHEEISHTVSFHFGWQANDKEGKNVQHTVEIN